MINKRRHALIQCPDGSKHSLTQFIMKFLGEKVFELTRYPHSLIDTPKKFKAFCDTNHIKGCTYITGTAETRQAS